MEYSTLERENVQRIAISSAFGPPRQRSTWSAAPASIADELERRGFSVHGIDASLHRAAYMAGGISYLFSGYGRFRYSEAISRAMPVRRMRASKLAAGMRRAAVTDVLHTGTLDMVPECTGDGFRHFLYCDQTWHLAIRYRPDAALFSPAALADFERFESDVYAACTHIFTFGKYVRDDLVTHYGVPAECVTAVGSGCGDSSPYDGEKDYANGEVLFVAKHLFKEKGGELLLAAFAILEKRRPDLKLTIIGGAAGTEKAALPRNVQVLPFVTREVLTGLFRRSALLVQPMLNDPWGQIYLEALLARTPVVGLDRNGLPEITGEGRYGFLVKDESPEALAEVIVDALSDADRLAAMGLGGQRHVIDNYSWSLAAARMAVVLAASRAAAVAPVVVSVPVGVVEPGVNAQPPSAQVLK